MSPHSSTFPSPGRRELYPPNGRRRGHVRAGLPLVLFTSALSCSSNHHVSEWGELGHPDLGLYVEAPDIDLHLRDIDADGDLRGLVKEHELRTGKGDTALVARSYSGRGSLGEEVHAIRVASSYGVILAAGPLASGDFLRHEPTELVLSLTAGPTQEESAFRSLTDLTGDGVPDVILRDEERHLSIFSLRPRGAVRIAVRMEVPPTEGSDIDGDGHVDLVGRVLLDADDVIRPELVDYATFDGERFSNRTPAAKAAHARDRDTRDALPPPADPRLTLRLAIERAWHSILAGDDRERALATLDAVKPAAGLASTFAMHRRRVAKISR
jgi:hypothetical protein